MKGNFDDTKSRVTFKLGDKEIPVKSDSDDSDDEYDANWALVLMSKRTYRKYQTQLINSRIDRDFARGGVSIDLSEVKERQPPPSVIKVTHYIPSNDKAANRQRSIRALEQTRERIAERTGRPPRLIYDPSTDLLLSRDAVDSSLYSTKEEQGGETSNAGLHYRSSVNALERLRDLRLLRRLDDVLEE